MASQSVSLHTWSARTIVIAFFLFIGFVYLRPIPAHAQDAYTKAWVGHSGNVVAITTSGTQSQLTDKGGNRGVQVAPDGRAIAWKQLIRNPVAGKLACGEQAAPQTR